MGKEEVLLGQRLKYLRMNAHKSQKDVADFIGVTISAYSLYEKDKREPTLSALIKIADYFRVTVDYLISGKENHTDRTGMSEDAIDTLAQTTKANDDIARIVDNLLSSEKFGQAMTHLASAWVMEVQWSESPQRADIIEWLNTWGLHAGRISMENKNARASQRMIKEWFLYRAKDIICEAFDDIIKEVNNNGEC